MSSSPSRVVPQPDAADRSQVSSATLAMQQAPVTLRVVPEHFSGVSRAPHVRKRTQGEERGRCQ
eukprot:3941384-Rhodomonas_salina.1